MSACRFSPGLRWRMRFGNLGPHYDGAIFVIDRADSDAKLHGHWIIPIPGRETPCAEDAALWRYGVSRQRLAALATRLGEGEAEVPAEVPEQPTTFCQPVVLPNVGFASLGNPGNRGQR